MTKDEALKLALEALEHCRDAIIERGLGGNPDFAEKWGLTLPLDRSNKAITAIKQALAAPVQSCYCPNCEAMGKELAALKAQPAPVQEPVAVTYKEVADAMNALWGGTLKQVQIATELANTKLYTTPPAPAVPDALFRHAPEHPQYIEGWNDCRAEMMKGMK